MQWFLFRSHHQVDNLFSIVLDVLCNSEKSFGGLVGNELDGYKMAECSYAQSTLLQETLKTQSLAQYLNFFTSA